MPWSADNIQIVLFLPGGGAFPDALQMFELLTGRAADSFQRQPGGGPMAPSTAQGSHDGFTPMINSQPGRLDFVFAGPLADTGLPGEFSDIEGGVAKFTDIAAVALETLSPYRISVVLNLIQEAASEPAAMALIGQLLPLPALPATTTDFQLQMNIKRPFVSHPDRIMNRLLKWGSGRQQLLNIPQTGIGLAAAPIIVQDRQIVQFTVDINSAVMVANAPFGNEQASAMLAELANEAVRLLHGGYGALTEDEN